MSILMFFMMDALFQTAIWGASILRSHENDRLEAHHLQVYIINLYIKRRKNRIVFLNFFNIKYRYRDGIAQLNSMVYHSIYHFLLLLDHILANHHVQQDNQTNIVQAQFFYQ